MPPGGRAADGARLTRNSWSPLQVAVDSKGQIYAADTYVGAVFIFNPETKAVSSSQWRTPLQGVDRFGGR